MPNTSASPTVIAPKTLPIIVATVAAADSLDFSSDESPGGEEELKVIVDRADEVDDASDDNGDGNDVLTEGSRYVFLATSLALLAILVDSGAPSFLANCPCRFSQHVSLM